MPILQWLQKDTDLVQAKNSAYKLLKEDNHLSYGDSNTDNMLVQGDNLEAIKALIPYYAGEIKCVFIDPPYNTKGAFEHYDDNMEHSKWLSLIYPRIELLRDLISEDGSIWVSIDDDEGHYLKVIMDEIFGRENFVANVVWEKKYSPQNDAKWFSDNHDHILVYAKNKNIWRPNLLERTEAMNNRYKNPDKDPRGDWKPGDLSVKTYNAGTDYPITTPSGRVVNPPKGYCWRVSKIKLAEMIEGNRIWFGPKGDGVPAIKRFLTDVKQGVTPMTIWKYTEVGHNQEAKKEVKNISDDSVFDTPKPERLIQRILHLSTKPGDFVLDSFLGSGTTAAVAHKMNRKYIGIEIGSHAKTHCQTRLKQVVDGVQVGISEAVNWEGGGGFKFYELGEAVFNEYGSLNSNIKFPTLAAHIWFLETKTSIKIKKASPLLGVHDGIAYYLLYNGILGDRRPQGGNVLTSKVLNDLPEITDKQKIVIYGESSRLGETRLKQHNITFKQIPYDVGSI
jgi:adenine-specific DNA-methyltransferase